ncbi:MAG: heparinase II/III family protein, partial [Planctomycetota bacterium]
QVILIDALESALGTDLGLTHIEPGFAETDRFLIHATAPSGMTFNFADADPEADRRNEPALNWFAWKFGRRYDTMAALPLPAEAVTSPASIRFEALRAIWLARDLVTLRSPEQAPLPLAWHGQGPQPVAIFRSSWQGQDASYLGTKGGRASVNHGHMDAGSFVLEAMGIRWAHDLGRQNYHALESQGFERLFDRDVQSPRWSLFRLGPYSHNTVTLNDGLHDPDATGKLMDVTSGEGFGEATYALGEILPACERWTRNFRLEHGGSLRVTDVIVGMEPGTRVRWAMLTGAEIAISSDGKSAELTQGGKTLSVKAEAPRDYRFRSAPARNEPAFRFDEPNPGRSLLLLEGSAGASGAVKLRVMLDWDHQQDETE